jgi:Methyltransferase domain
VGTVAVAAPGPASSLTPRCEQLLARLELNSVCTLIRARADAVADEFSVESIGLLHVDGNHSEALSMRDVTLYLPKVAPGGHIFFDDISWTENAVVTTHRALRYLLEHGCQEVDRTGDCAILRKMGPSRTGLRFESDGVPCR